MQVKKKEIKILRKEAQSLKGTYEKKWGNLEPTKSFYVYQIN